MTKFLNYSLSFFTQNTNNIELSGKVIILTGACTPIGKALAENLYMRGSHLILIGNDTIFLQTLKNQLSILQTSHLTIPPTTIWTDLTDVKNHQNCVESIINEHKHIDMLINNSNTNFVGEVINTSLGTDIEIMSRNYFSQIEFTRVVLKQMVKSLSGHVIFITSIQGIHTDPLYSAFGASQHALLAFANILREDIMSKNVKVTTICLPKQLTESTICHNAQDQLDNNSTRIASDIMEAIIAEKNHVTIEPLHKKINVYIKELLPNFYLKFLHSKV